jgi:hypothetical protein
MITRSCFYLAFLSTAAAVIAALIFAPGTVGAAPVDCSRIRGTDTYRPGLERSGPAGYTVTLVDAQPAPPARGNNAWRIRVLKPNRTPARGANLSVDTWMPDHGHGSPITASVTAGAAAGEYVLDPVSLFMPGTWEVTITIRSGATEVDAVTFTFCIEGR